MRGGADERGKRRDRSLVWLSTVRYCRQTAVTHTEAQLQNSGP